MFNIFRGFNLRGGLVFFCEWADTVLCIFVLLNKYFYLIFSGVFQDHIKYLLCITTANYITILGVCFSETNSGKLNSP